jgi:hypothetical protein
MDKKKEKWIESLQIGVAKFLICRRNWLKFQMNTDYPSQSCFIPHSGIICAISVFVLFSSSCVTLHISVGLYLWVIYDNIYVVWFLFVSKYVFLRLPRIGLYVALRRILMTSDQMEPCWTSDRNKVISSMINNQY